MRPGEQVLKPGHLLRIMTELRADGGQQHVFDDLLRQRITRDGTAIAEQQLGFEIHATAFERVAVFEDGNVRGAAANIDGHQTHACVRAASASHELDPVFADVVESANLGKHEGKLAGDGFIEMHEQRRTIPAFMNGPFVAQMAEREDIQRLFPLAAIVRGLLAAPARGEGHDDVAQTARDELMVALPPLRRSDLTIRQLHDAERGPSHRIRSRIRWRLRRCGRTVRRVFRLVRRLVHVPVAAIAGQEAQHRTSELRQLHTALRIRIPGIEHHCPPLQGIAAHGVCVPGVALRRAERIIAADIELEIAKIFTSAVAHEHGRQLHKHLRHAGGDVVSRLCRRTFQKAATDLLILAVMFLHRAEAR